MDWTQGPRRSQINLAMTGAWEAMDRFYYHSHTNEQLLANAEAVSKAVAEVRRHARANHYLT